MPHGPKLYASVLPRHQRLLFFVDSTISEKALRNLMEANHLIWGGRYNPIIPVYNNNIGEEWIEMLKHFDPDIIYYSPSIDLQYLESLRFFQPKEYIEIKDGSRNYFPGVGSYCLLNDNVHNFFITDHTTVLRYEGPPDMQIPAKLFYQLNMGFRPIYLEEKRWLKSISSIPVTEENVSQINELICKYRPYFSPLLSALHVNSIQLTRNKSWKDSRFEWIVYESGNYLDDLLYYWNRQLYIEPKNRLNQVIATMAEVQVLLKDKWIGPLLHHLSVDNHVFLVSRSLNGADVEVVQSEMQLLSKNTRIEVDILSEFPYKPDGVRRICSNQIKAVKNLILGKSDYLKLPQLNFEGGQTIDDGPYVVDFVLERESANGQQEIKFPYGTELHFVLCKESSRVNRTHRASVFINRDKPGFDIVAPDDMRLIRSVLMYRKQHRRLLELPVSDLYPSSAGQKLSAFLKIFQNNWQTVADFLGEAFWLQLFRYESKIKDSGIAAGRGVFSYKDLEKEIRELYKQLRPEVEVKLQGVRDTGFDSTSVDEYLKRSIAEAFSYHIDDNLNYLIEHGGLFVGMKVKCHHCGSNKWYSLTELRDKLPCKGCASEIMPLLASKVYFKLSDTIVNNVLADQTKNGKEYDGNYVVMKTLLHLKNDMQEAGNSFIWAPCLDFKGKTGNHVIASDADIVAIQNGDLVLGEAKFDATEFTEKVIDSLVWMANELLADKLIVACAKGNLENVVQVIEGRLTNKACKVLSYRASAPWYQLPGIFGLSPIKK